MDNEFKQSLKEFTAGCLAGIDYSYIQDTLSINKHRIFSGDSRPTF